MTRPLRILMSAGEASGDRLGAGLAEAIRQRRPDAELLGMGGDAMAASGAAWVAVSDESLRLRIQVLFAITLWPPKLRIF